MRAKKSVAPKTGADVIMEPSTISSARLPKLARALVPTSLSVDLEPAPYDPVQAQADLAELRPRLTAIRADRVRLPRLDVDSAALAALSVYTFIEQIPSVKERFIGLGNAGAFDVSNLADLKKLAFVLIYTREVAERSGAFENSAKVPASVFAEALEVEARMQRLCEYLFTSDEEIEPLLELLRPGTGYADLARDLNGYADIYTMRPDAVSAESVNYRETDVDDARRLAGEILSHLARGYSPRARQARDQFHRVWTMMLDVYQEVRQAGMFLLRYEADVEQRFPSLYTIGRPNVGGRRVDAGEDEPSDDDGPVDATAG